MPNMNLDIVKTLKEIKLIVKKEKNSLFGLAICYVILTYLLTRVVEINKISINITYYMLFYVALTSIIGRIRYNKYIKVGIDKDQINILFFPFEHTSFLEEKNIKGYKINDELFNIISDNFEFAKENEDGLGGKNLEKKKINCISLSSKYRYLSDKKMINTANKLGADIVINGRILNHDDGVSIIPKVFFVDNIKKDKDNTVSYLISNFHYVTSMLLFDPIKIEKNSIEEIRNSYSKFNQYFYNLFFMIVSLIGLGEEIDEIKTDNNKKFIYRQEFEYFKTRIDRVIGQFGYGVDLILNFFLTRLATKIDINDDKRDELICKYFDESVRLLEKIDNKSVYRKIGFAIYHEYANYLKRRQIDKKYKEFIKKGDTKKAIELLDKSNNILPTVHTLRGYKKMYEKGLISDDKISNVYDSSKMLVFKYDYLSKIKTKYKCLFYKAVFSYYLGKKGYKKDFDFILQGKEKYMEMIMTQYGKSNYNSYAKKYDELCNKVNNFMKEHNIN